MKTRLSLPERLHSLPAFEAPAGGWSDLQRRMTARPRRRPYARLALAASVLAAIGIALLQPQQRAEPTRRPAPDSELRQLMAQSQALEQSLSRIKPQVAVWDGRQAATARSIKTELAVVDLQLNYAEPESARRLWRNRVALMSQLVSTHEQAALMPASLTVTQEQSL